MLSPRFDWDTCKVSFEKDGSLRDIYVLEATLDDWRAVLTLLTAPSYCATIDGARASGALPDLAAHFARPDAPPHWMSFRVGRVEVNCHFFLENEIEFDFAPNGLTEGDLGGLLTFVSTLGSLTGKPVVLTPENGPTHPIFRYDPRTRVVQYAPAERGVA